MLIEAYLLIYIQFQFVLDELRRFFLRRSHCRLTLFPSRFIWHKFKLLMI